MTGGMVFCCTEGGFFSIIKNDGNQRGRLPKEGKHMNKNVADDALRGLMGRRMPAWARYALVLAATAVFAVFAYHARYAKIDEFTGFRMEEMTRLIAGVLAALYALTVAVELHIGRKLNVGAQALLCVVVGLNSAAESLAVRLCERRL